MYQFITLERQDDGVAVITFNRPDRLNAWDSEMRAEIAAAFQECNADQSVRAVIMTGAGERAFSAGEDFNESINYGDIQTDKWIAEWRNFFGAIRDMDKGVVAAVNGVAAGSGFQVALLADIRVAHPGVRMGQLEINSGIPSSLGPWLMWDIMGRSRTVEFTLTGRQVPADELHQIGIIHHLVPADQVMTRAREIARELADKPPIAMRLVKQRLREMSAAGFEAALAAGARVQHDAYASGEPQRMMEKFFAERAARRKQRQG